MQHQEVGDLVPLARTFKNLAGVDTDPAVTTIEVTPPGGPVTAVSAPPGDPGLTNPSVGHWLYALNLTSAGIWSYRWSGSGNGVGVADLDQFIAVGLGSTGPGWCERWATWAQVVDVAPAAWKAALAAVDEADQGLALDWATDLLYGLTGSRYPGLCRGTFGICGCCRSWECRWQLCTGTADHADLVDVGWPVWGASGVYANGVLLPPESFRIDEHRWLVRLDGEFWPSCPDLAADPRNAQATLIYGQSPYAGGDLAAARLAGFGVLSGAAACGGIPDDVVGLQREGVTYQLDPKEFESGRTGLGAVDSWLAAEKMSRRTRSGGFDPARHAELTRLGTDQGLDQ